MNCQKCPINKKNRAKSDDETFNNTDCIEILHSATLEALKNLVQLVDLQKEENFVLEARLEGSQGANEILKAEIEAQCKAVKYYQKKATEIKTEAIKEFAERLKNEKTTAISCDLFEEVIRKSDIDNLVKEMVGDTE